MSGTWYYAEGDKAVGPVTLADLKKLFSLVSNAKDVLVWRPGFVNWERAESVTDLASLLAPTPPPLPPIPPPLPRSTASLSEPIAKQPTPDDAKGSIKSRWRRELGWLVWWYIDPVELYKQASQYDTIPFMRSARGMAVLCLLFSCVVGLILAYLKLIALDELAFDCAVFVVLAIFIYRGHRWAILAAMGLWTYEQGLAVYNAVVGGVVVGGVRVHLNPVMQIIWWCIYMHCFYLAFRVEQQRRLARKTADEDWGRRLAEIADEKRKLSDTGENRFKSQPQARQRAAEERLKREAEEQRDARVTWSESLKAKFPKESPSHKFRYQIEEDGSITAINAQGRRMAFRSWASFSDADNDLLKKRWQQEVAAQRQAKVERERREAEAKRAAEQEAWQRAEEARQRAAEERQKREAEEQRDARVTWSESLKAKFPKESPSHEFRYQIEEDGSVTAINAQGRRMAFRNWASFSDADNDLLKKREIQKVAAQLGHLIGEH
jgi:hypothetical protein